MVRKKRKLTAVKKRKKSKVPSRQKKQSVKVRKSKQRSRTVGDRFKSAYRTLVDTIKDADNLRDKLEPPGTSETE
jgi:myosin heavy subunit